MLGLMQPWPLTVDRILDHAVREHGDLEIVTRSSDGPITRTTYADLRGRARQIRHGLLESGISPGDHVVTLAMNSNHHIEACYGVMGVGAVCHTLNPRMHPEQLAAVIRHGGDRVLVDAAFVTVLEEELHVTATAVERVAVLAAEGIAGARGEGTFPYEGWIAGRPSTDREGAPVWGGFDDRCAYGLCHTSGTTRDPKGVLYSHRSIFSDTMMSLQPDVLDLSATDVPLSVVPMLHANAWSVAFAAPAVGGKLVLPGAKFDGASIHEPPTPHRQLVDTRQDNFRRQNRSRRHGEGRQETVARAARRRAECGRGTAVRVNSLRRQRCTVRASWQGRRDAAQP